MTVKMDKKGAGQVHACDALSKVKAEDIMSSPVFTIPLKAEIRELAELFLEKNISAAAVIDSNDVPVGVITKTDLVRWEHDHVDAKVRDKKPRARDTGEAVDGLGLHEIAEDDVVEQWMTPFIFDTTPGTPLVEVAQKMVKYGCHHIFVTEPELKRVIGIITTFDVLQLYARAMSEEHGHPEKLLS